MASARKTGSDREATLRRIAIVLSSLPAPIASRLLGTIDPESMRHVRNTMSGLTDIDPMERRLALQAFKGSVEQHQPSRDQSSSTATVRSSGATRAGDIEDEIVISRTARQSTHSQAASRVVSQAESPTAHSQNVSHASADRPSHAPLAFLNDVDDATLLSLLSGEHPQTIALVLASIAPSQAAHVLPRLDSSVQSDALSRIGRLGDIPGEAVNEIAEHLQERIQQRTKEFIDSSGNRALNAILAAMPKTTPHQTAERPMDETESAANRPVPAARMPIESVGFSSTEVPAIDQLHRMTAGEQTWPDNDATAPSIAIHDPSRLDPNDRSQDVAAGAGQHARMPPGESVIFESTDAIHQHLVGLSPSDLCQALSRVETRVALLTLCGLPSELAESVLNVLPRSHSKQVRRQLRSMGTLQLREIDEAKETVARASVTNAAEPAANPPEAISRVPIAA